jgi:F-type H+-transporting ATPase subunit b
MRTKVLAGAVFGIALVLMMPGIAGAAELTKDEAAHEAGKAAEEAGLDKKVVECVEHAIQKADTEACIQAPSPILPATNEIIYGGLAFLVVFIGLAKFGLPALRAMLDERSERIASDLGTAEAARVEAETVLGEYQRQLADARAESSRIIEEARQQAEQVRRDLIARAETEAADLRQRNADQVTAERDRVLGEMRGQVANLAVELAEKVVEANLDRDANLRLIENYINSVGAR